ncbi:MAG: MBL fold metallo-hydrolase, partial [bacterium]
MRIRWYGHACWRIEFPNNISLLTDPFKKGSFDNKLRYDDDFARSDIVTISHEHYDHNNRVFKNAQYIDRPGQSETEGIRITGYTVYHDKSEGEERGSNIIFIIEHNNKKIVHLGDLGHIPSDDIIENLKAADILFIPVGGYFTIEPEEAVQLTEMLNPDTVFPMHYKTEKVDFPIRPVDDFLELAKSRKILRIDKPYVDYDGFQSG